MPAPSPGLGDSQLGYYSPASSNANRQLLDLTDASASIAVAEGWYEAYLATTSIQGATGKIGGAASVPVSGAAEGAGFCIPPGSPYMIRIRAGETALHAIMNAASATGKLWLTRLR